MRNDGMGADVLILGQGLAGTVLAWACGRAGVAWRICDPGHAGTATRAAAGILNPITGRRLVPAPRFAELRACAREMFLGMEAELGVPLWRDVRVRRFFADEGERRVWAERSGRGEFEAWGGAAEADGFWIEGAARVDLPALLAAARARWRAQGRLEERAVTLREALAETRGVVVDCRGAAAASDPAWAGVPAEFSRGEVLDLAAAGLAPEVVLNRRHWVLPVADGAAWIGATHEPGIREMVTTGAGRAVLEASARELLGARAWTVTGQRAGVRVNLPDRRPAAGWHPTERRLGWLGGLGGRGASWAPWLAEQWVRHLTTGAEFESATGTGRWGWGRVES